METDYLRQVINRLDISNRKAEASAKDMMLLLRRRISEQAESPEEEIYLELENRVQSLSLSIRRINSIKTQAMEIIREYERLEEDSLETVKQLFIE